MPRPCRLCGSAFLKGFCQRDSCKMSQASGRVRNRDLPAQTLRSSRRKLKRKRQEKRREESETSRGVEECDKPEGGGEELGPECAEEEPAADIRSGGAGSPPPAPAARWNVEHFFQRFRICKSEDCVWVVCDPLSVFVGDILEVAELDGDGHYILKPIAGRMYPCVRVRRQEARGFCRLAYNWLRMVVESEGTRGGGGAENIEEGGGERSSGGTMPG